MNYEWELDSDDEDAAEAARAFLSARRRVDRLNSWLRTAELLMDVKEMLSEEEQLKYVHEETHVPVELIALLLNDSQDEASQNKIHNYIHSA